ncbi:MAG TPA: ATP-binding cassette domain-containing protein [Syntrophales bacterium]|nr:ATP-binding cassette domain-containing protein [Syntrophales bacterium]
MDGTPLLEIRQLKKYFPVKSSFGFGPSEEVKAVDSVELCIQGGETLGVVGESGCGKTTLGRMILRLIEPTSGEIFFKGEDIVRRDKKDLYDLRRKMQIIFQDPYSSLNPRQSAGDIIGEPLIVHNLANKRNLRNQVSGLMEVVGLSPDQYDRYPHEFSGGQRQRIGIARALSLKPEFIVCDEPVSALDVSIKAQVLNLLVALQKEFNLTYMLISHDLGIVKHVSDRVAVMYLGRLVELSYSRELYRSPYHPYTQALLSASPIPDPTLKRERIFIEGDIPSPIHPPAGCHFHTRCRFRIERCISEPPPWEEVSHSHWARCWRSREIQNIK